MKHLFTLLLGISLVATSCDTDSPKPASPELVGRWNAQGSTGFTYNAAGQLLSEDKVLDQTFYLEIKQDSMHYRSVRDGSSQGSHAYTRQGNTITYGRNAYQASIITLDEHHLTLRFPDPNRKAGASYQEVEDHYTR
ncbi:hypothetical protein [Hymenobacter pini]|uniref:hypothetical protein n=1 Tax=Hymenobacter pini TaxID=2880879 RepID=UPI001CF2FEF9|nr:hypothetical protein [Hymenobacter pini]MCA8830146.1 hypothetical protein [Hymenobacter pini]